MSFFLAFYLNESLRLIYAIDIINSEWVSDINEKLNLYYSVTNIRLVSKFCRSLAFCCKWIL